MAHKCDGCKYKGEHQEMMFRPFGVCNRGANLLEAVQNYEAKKCPYKKTNADRIRDMSDEELVDWLLPYLCCSGCPMQDYCSTNDLPCEKVILEWLQQPCEEGEANE
jgi:hypothetical protein